MRPLSLQLINFANHNNSFIDFTKLPNFSLIVGVENNNTAISNATGKTNIFNGIKYCLFDAKFSKNKERVIRDGADKAESKFVFEHCDNIYKIERYKTKTTQGVKLFLQNKDGKSWENLTERTTSQTNAKILHLLKINEQTFENAFYLKQNDYKRRKIDALASATPEERKEIIFDMLKLNAWEKYEKVSKKIRDELNIILVKLDQKIQMLGQPERDIDVLQNNLINIDKNIIEKQLLQKEKQDELKLLNETIDELKKLLPKDDGNELLQEYLALGKELQISENEIVALKKKLVYYTEEIDKNKEIINDNDCAEHEKQLHVLLEAKKEKPNENEYNELLNKLSELQAENRNINAQLKVFSKPIPSDEICKECGTELSVEHKEELLSIKNANIAKYNKMLNEVMNKTSKLLLDKKEFENQFNEYNAFTKTHTKLINIIEQIKADINKANSNIEYYEKTINDLSKDLERRINNHNESIKQFKELKENLNKIDKNKIKEQKDYIASKEVDSVCLNKQIASIMNEIFALNKNKGATESQLEASKNNQQELCKLIEDKKILSYKHNIAKIGTSCFSTNGVPAMIIQSALDSLQIETNNILEQMALGAKIQFLVSKEKTDGSKTDTLDILFIINGKELDFLDLSGGQQCMFVTAIKLATAQISRQRCDSDIKLLLMDETDQALDDNSVDGLYNVIKKISKDITVLLITHNKELKKRFDKVIMVNQTFDGSQASVVNLTNM